MASVANRAHCRRNPRAKKEKGQSRRELSERLDVGRPEMFGGLLRLLIRLPGPCLPVAPFVTMAIGERKSADGSGVAPLSRIHKEVDSGGAGGSDFVTTTVETWSGGRSENETPETLITTTVLRIGHLSGCIGPTEN
jgi:hypothetical protein